MIARIDYDQLIEEWEGYMDTASGGLPVIANKSRLEAHIGMLLPEDLFKFAPWGNRIIVVREPAIRKIGEIIVPEVAVEKLAEGWVLSAGPTVSAECPYSAERLIGCKVVFAKYAGDNLDVTTKDPLVDQEKAGLFSIMRIGDVWGTVGDPPEKSVLDG